MVIQIGELEFRSKKEATAHFRALLDRYWPGSMLIPRHKTQVMWLLSRHTESAEKIGCGVMSISVEKHPVFGSKCFIITRMDGTKIDFSYIHCIDAKPKTLKRRVIEAMRYEIHDQIILCKRNAFVVDKVLSCPISGEQITWESCHVDHVIPFDDIAKAFIDLHYPSLSPEMLEPSADMQFFERLAVPEMLIEWQRWHHKVAVLRVVSAKANLTRKRGGGHD